MKRFYLSFLLAWASPAISDAQSRILSTEAISYTRYVEKSDFDERFPGVVLKAGETPTEPGYYVVYQHERLIYYFGPEQTYFAAELYKDDLDAVVKTVQEKRERLNTAQTSIQKYPQEARSESNPSGDRSASENEAQGQDEASSNSGAPSTPQPEPWWQKLLNVFGF